MFQGFWWRLWCETRENAPKQNTDAATDDEKRIRNLDRLKTDSRRVNVRIFAVLYAVELI